LSDDLARIYEFMGMGLLPKL